MSVISTTFNPKTQAQVKATDDKIGYIAKNTKLTYGQVKQLVQTVLETALELTKADCKKWITAYVPYRTGQLQDSLLSNLDSSTVASGKFLRLVLGTHLNYAQYVNKMSDSKVRHYSEVGYAYYYGHFGKIMLNDPGAIGHYHGLMLMYARAQLKKHLRQVNVTIAGSVGVSAKPISDQLKVTT